jgi:hypothetical protein
MVEAQSVSAGLSEAGAGERGVRVIALHAADDVEHRLAMPRDEVAALSLGCGHVPSSPELPVEGNGKSPKRAKVA